MKKMKRITVVIVFALVAISLMVATSGADVVSHHETDVLELNPAQQAEGTYTQIDDDTGEIKIILAQENPNLEAHGVNDDAVTDIGPVFTIENVLEQKRDATVWIEHDSDAVEFYAPGAGTIESEEEGVSLHPGESITVALLVDTRETDELTLESIGVLAKLVSQGDTPDESGDPGDRPGDSPGRGQSAGSPSETPTATGMPTSTPTATPPVTDTPTSAPSGSTESTATDSSSIGDDDRTTSTDPPEEEAGLGLDPWLLGGVAAVVCAAGGGLLLTRRLGYL